MKIIRECSVGADMLVADNISNPIYARVMVKALGDAYGGKDSAYRFKDSAYRFFVAEDNFDLRG